MPRSRVPSDAELKALMFSGIKPESERGAK
jgi:hypothetical protein